MGVLKNDVGRPSKKTKIIRGILKLIGLLIIIVAGLYIGYVIGKDKNKVDEKNKSEIKEESKKVAKKDFDFEEAKKILDKYILTGYTDLVYNNLSNDYKLVLAINKSKPTKNKTYTCKQLYGDACEKKDENQNYYTIEFKEGYFGAIDEKDSNDVYLYEDVLESYKKLFSDVSTLSKISVSVPEGGGEKIYAYSQKENLWKELSCECGGYYPNQAAKIIDSYIYNNELVIEFTYLEAMDNNLTQNFGEKIVASDIETSDYELSEDQIEDYIDTYMDKLNKYKLTFKIKNSNYLLENFEVIK